MFAWTLAHVTQQVDSWVNVRFRGRAPHPLISHERFRMGTTGAGSDWPAIQQAVKEVRESARQYLAGLGERDLDRAIPYTGSLTVLQDRDLTLRYALLRIAAHHYFHVGDVAARRTGLGQEVGDYPGPLADRL